MPTYEYRCDNCGHQFDEFQSITADALCDCPKCKKSSLQRLIGGGNGLIFKGSGFYITDYKNSKSSNGNSSKSETKSEKKEQAKAKTKTDSSD